MNPIYLAIYIGTTNDTSGNPRRGWYVSRMDGKPVVEAAPTGRKGETEPAYTVWVEEGYRGRGALNDAARHELNDPELESWAASDWVSRHVHVTGRIEVTPAEYRAARKLPRFGGAS